MDWLDGLFRIQIEKKYVKKGFKCYKIENCKTNINNFLT